MPDKLVQPTPATLAAIITAVRREHYRGLLRRVGALDIIAATGLDRTSAMVVLSADESPTAATFTPAQITQDGPAAPGADTGQGDAEQSVTANYENDGPLVAAIGALTMVWIGDTTRARTILGHGDPERLITVAEDLADLCNDALGVYGDHDGQTPEATPMEPDAYRRGAADLAARVTAELDNLRTVHERRELFQAALAYNGAITSVTAALADLGEPVDAPDDADRARARTLLATYAQAAKHVDDLYQAPEVRAHAADWMTRAEDTIARGIAATPAELTVTEGPANA